MRTTQGVKSVYLLKELLRNEQTISFLKLDQFLQHRPWLLIQILSNKQTHKCNKQTKPTTKKNKQTNLTNK